MLQQQTPINFIRVASDINGNSRYVCHFLNLLSEAEKGYFCQEKQEYIEGTISSKNRYEIAIKRANKIGGRKYHTKAFGGGIVFQSVNTCALQAQIYDLINGK